MGKFPMFITRVGPWQPITFQPPVFWLIHKKKVNHSMNSKDFRDNVPRKEKELSLNKQMDTEIKGWEKKTDMDAEGWRQWRWQRRWTWVDTVDSSVTGRGKDGRDGEGIDRIINDRHRWRWSEAMYVGMVKKEVRKEDRNDGGRDRCQRERVLERCGYRRW